MMARRQTALQGLEVTEIVADGDLKRFLRDAHKAGGRLKMSAPVREGDVDSYAVTMVYL